MREISATELAEMLKSGETVQLIDVREPWEHQRAVIPNSVLIPLRDLPQRIAEIDTRETTKVVLYCHAGMRSRHAAAWLSNNADVKNLFNLAGGIHAWSLEVDPSVPTY